MQARKYLGSDNPGGPAHNRPPKRSAMILVSTAIAAGLILSGCASDNTNTTVDTTNPPTTATTPIPAVATEPTVEPSPTEYIPASSAGPARNVPLPQVPWEISYDNEKGAKAAVQYWHDVLRYVELTGDPKPLETISDPDCAFCNRAMRLIPELYEEGRWIDRGRYIIDNATVETDEESGITTVFGVLIHEPTVFYAADGSEISDETIKTDLAENMIAEVYFSEEQNHIVLLSFFAESQ